MFEIFHWSCSFPLQSCLQKALEKSPALEESFYSCHFCLLSASILHMNRFSLESKRTSDTFQETGLQQGSAHRGGAETLWKCAPAVLASWSVPSGYTSADWEELWPHGCYIPGSSATSQQRFSTAENQALRLDTAHPSHFLNPRISISSECRQRCAWSNQKMTDHFPQSI